MNKFVLLSASILLLSLPAAAEISQDLQNELDDLGPQDRVEVLVQTGPSMTDQHVNNMNELGEVRGRYDTFDGIYLELPVPAVERLAERDFVDSVEPNYRTEVFLSESAEQVKADAVWDYEVTGDGVETAILDTGIHSDHQDLTVSSEVDFTGEGVEDLNGHGTHVAGIVGSQNVENRGLAYGSSLNNVKVLNEEGQGSGSDLLEGMEWAVDNDMEVAVLSLGAEVEECDGKDILSQAVDDVTDEGVFVTVAAGNEGPEEQSVTIPGCSREGTTVGSVNKDNELASYSSRGPTSDGRTKPDLVAPGSNIESTWNDGEFNTISGTSMATPHVAGQAALLLEADNELTPSEIKNVVTNTADDLGLDSNEQGNGLINVNASYHEVAEPQEEEEEKFLEIEQPSEGESFSIEEELTVSWSSTHSYETGQTLENSELNLEGDNISYSNSFDRNESVESGETASYSFDVPSEELEESSEAILTVTDNWENETETESISFTLTSSEQEEEDSEEEDDSSQRGERGQGSAEARGRSGFFGPDSRMYGLRIAADRASVAVGLQTREQVMEKRANEARQMQESGNSQGADRALNEMRRSAGNSENASREAEETLDRVMEGAPEEAQEGLRNALRNVEERRQTQDSGRSEGPQEGQQPGEEQQQELEDRQPDETDREQSRAEESREQDQDRAPQERDRDQREPNQAQEAPEEENLSDEPGHEDRDERETQREEDSGDRTKEDSERQLNEESETPSNQEDDEPQDSNQTQADSEEENDSDLNEQEDQEHRSEHTNQSESHQDQQTDQEQDAFSPTQ